jgi:hypothetical protein
VSDDSHCLAVYESQGMWGTLAKSDFPPLKSREPIYPYLALGLSYFEGYYNRRGKRTMRSFTVPVDLERFEGRGWRFSEEQLVYIDHALDRAPKAWKLPRQRIKLLTRVGGSGYGRFSSKSKARSGDTPDEQSTGSA